MDCEQFRQLVDLLHEMANVIAIIALAQMMAEATTDEQKNCFAQTLAMFFGNRSPNPHFSGMGQRHEMPYEDQRFF